MARHYNEEEASVEESEQEAYEEEEEEEEEECDDSSSKKAGRRPTSKCMRHRDQYSDETSKNDSSVFRKQNWIVWALIFMFGWFCGSTWEGAMCDASAVSYNPLREYWM